MAARARKAHVDKYHYDRYIGLIVASLFTSELCAKALFRQG
jgi:hypothetical protein